MPNYWPDEMQKIRPHLAKKKVIFHHDNAPAHTFALAKAKLVKLGYELLPHSPYSPDLAPCYLNEEVVAATEAYFADLEKSDSSDGLKKLEQVYRAKRRLC